MANNQPIKSIKRMMINKAYSTTVLVLTISIFITVFSLISSKTLLGQMAYQNKITSAKQTALNQLKQDVSTKNNLVKAYQSFVNTSPNIIGGIQNGSSYNDGDNAKIILDALPSKYDFPALLTYMQNLLSNQGVTVNSITGSDDQLQHLDASPESNPIAVDIPLNLSFTGNYPNIVNIINVLNRSIRPIQITSVQLSGSQTNLGITIVAQTYYQPQKGFSISTEVIK